MVKEVSFFDKGHITLTISHRNLFILFLLVVIPILPPGISSIIIFVTFMILAFPLKNEKMHIYFEIWPLIALVFIGAISGLSLFFENGSIYFYFRDIFYFLIPVLSLSIGYYLAKRSTNKNQLFRIIVLGAFLASITNYAEFLFGFNPIANDFMESRYEYQLNSGMALIGFSILYFSGVAKYSFFKKGTRLGLMAFFSVLIIISLSRANIGALLIILILPGVLRFIPGRSQLYMLGPIILLVVFAGAVLSVAVPDSVATNFGEKVLNSGSEMVVRDYEGAANINQYWRSYEAFLGLQEYLDTGYFGMLFGQGFGSYASASHIFESKFQYIVIFHNGFITILLKTGVIGVFLFFLFLNRIIGKKLDPTGPPEERFYSQLSVGLMWILVINTYVIHGLYTPNVNTLLLVLLGCIFYIRFGKIGHPIRG